MGGVNGCARFLCPVASGATPVWPRRCPPRRPRWTGPSGAPTTLACRCPLTWLTSSTEWSRCSGGEAFLPQARRNRGLFPLDRLLCQCKPLHTWLVSPSSIACLVCLVGADSGSLLLSDCHCLSNAPSSGTGTLSVKGETRRRSPTLQYLCIIFLDSSQTRQQFSAFTWRHDVERFHGCLLNPNFVFFS